MKIVLSRRNFLIKSSKGLAGAGVVYVFSNNLNLAPDWLSIKPKNNDSTLVSGIVCEFGVEGSAPREAEELDIFLKATRALGAGFIVCQFAPEYTTPDAR